MKQYLIYNGELYPSDTPIITANNRSFRYGDGCFETMKMIDGDIVFDALHWQRLFSSIPVLQFDVPVFFSPEYFLQQIKTLTQKNNHQRLARIRITIFRGDGNLNDANNKPNYVIQSWALQQIQTLNENGLVIDIYNDARKQTDSFSSLKNNNYLPYSMATIWSKKNNIDDALIINNSNRIAEATTSNIFIVKNNIITTPALQEGCIAGVTRSYLLHCLRQANLPHEEAELTTEDLLTADELFLTNAGWYIRWVKRFRSKGYTNETAKFLFAQFISPLLTKKNKNNS